MRKMLICLGVGAVLGMAFMPLLTYLIISIVPILLAVLILYLLTLTMERKDLKTKADKNKEAGDKV